MRRQDQGGPAGAGGAEGGEGEPLVDIVGVDDVRVEAGGDAGDLKHREGVEEAQVQAQGGRHGAPDALHRHPLPAD